jgi:hypothetical protein
MMTAGTMSTLVADRARDPLFEGTTQAQLIGLLSYAQQVVNGVLSEITGSATLTVPVRTVIFLISTSLPSAVKILTVQNAGRDLDAIPYDMLQQIDLRWPVAVSGFHPEPTSFTTCGRDILILHPGVTTARTMTVVYGLLTTPLVLTSDSTVTTNETDNAIMDLGEILLLLKGRDFAPVQDAIERMKKRLTGEEAEER